MSGKVWDEITHPIPNGATVEVWEWISNLTPHLMMYGITYPCLPDDLIRMTMTSNTKTRPPVCRVFDMIIILQKCSAGIFWKERYTDYTVIVIVVVVFVITVVLFVLADVVVVIIIVIVIIIFIIITIITLTIIIIVMISLLTSLLLSLLSLSLLSPGHLEMDGHCELT